MSYSLYGSAACCGRGNRPAHALQLVASVDDNSIRVWDTRTCDQLYELRQHKGLAFVLECHPTDSRIGMWGAYDGVVHIFDLATGAELSRCGPAHPRRLTPC